MPVANEVRESRMPEIGQSGLQRAEAARYLSLRYSTELLLNSGTIAAAAIDELLAGKSINH
jgi:hypothetical protein